VEVRLVTGEVVDPTAIRPLFFVSNFMKGSLTVDVFRCRDEATSGRVDKSLTEKGIALQILGQRNSAGKPAVCVARRVPSDDPAPGTAAVFCLLRSWSISKRMLYLDLPREYFAEAGKMHVWFLRGDRIVWQEEFDWSGWEREVERPAGPTPRTQSVGF
jgi:hypothetical protein